ncbi:MAG: tetratricopeptide repeat protein [Vulcanimicrobiota bacterium]
MTLEQIAAKIAAGEWDGLAELLRPHAAADDLEAQYLLGSLLLTDCSASNLELLGWLDRAVSKGHAGALYLKSMLGEVSEDSLCTGGPQTDEQRELLQRAAQLGWADAQRDLGCLLATGEGGFAQDGERGRYWYQQAAEQGHSDAQYNLAIMLLAGEGGPPDPVEGMRWLGLAARAPDGGYFAGVAADILSAGAFGVRPDPQRAAFYRQLESNSHR